MPPAMTEEKTLWESDHFVSCLHRNFVLLVTVEKQMRCRGWVKGPSNKHRGHIRKRQKLFLETVALRSGLCGNYKILNPKRKNCWGKLDALLNQVSVVKILLHPSLPNKHYPPSSVCMWSAFLSKLDWKGSRESNPSFCLGGRQPYRASWLDLLLRLASTGLRGVLRAN